MGMIYGWADNTLRIDLTRKKIVKEPFPKDLGILFVGGAGINAKILYDEIGPEVTPFDPDNRLIFGTGSLVGSSAPCSARITVTAKGPFTFAFCDSNAGGFFSPELKWAGYEHIVFQGRAEKPVYLLIDDDLVELRDAAHLWGKDVIETDKIIKEEIGFPEVRTAIIGTGGENLVRYAAVMFDLWRAAGWGGAGAVMGSKNLKAIAVKGTKKPKIARPEEFETTCRKIRETIINGPRTKLLRRYGRLHNIDLYQRTRTVGNRNFLENVVPPDKFPKVTSERFVEEVWDKNSLTRSCFNCPVACSHRFMVREGPYIGTTGQKIEYNQVADSILMGIYNTRFMAKWTFETNRYGLDTDGASNAIAWAMECYEKGILTAADCDGLQLKFGDEEVALKLVEMIANREGRLGDLLAEGSQFAARKLGRGSEKYAMHIKGARLIMAPGSAYGVTLAHVVSTRGADHLKGAPFSVEFYPFDVEQRAAIGRKLFGHPEAVNPQSPNGKGYLVKWMEDHNAVVDSLGLCQTQTKYIALSLPGFDEFALLLSLATGVPFTADDLKIAGERIIMVERAFNAKCGLTRDDDTLPDRFFEARTDVKIIDRETLEKMKDEYYEARGCEIKTGAPTKRRLEELGLKDIAADFEAPQSGS